MSIFIERFLIDHMSIILIACTERLAINQQPTEDRQLITYASAHQTGIDDGDTLLTTHQNKSIVRLADCPLIIGTCHQSVSSIIGSHTIMIITAISLFRTYTSYTIIRYYPYAMTVILNQCTDIQAFQSAVCINGICLPCAGIIDTHT